MLSRSRPFFPRSRSHLSVETLCPKSVVQLREFLPPQPQKIRTPGAVQTQKGLWLPPKKCRKLSVFFHENKLIFLLENYFQGGVNKCSCLSAKSSGLLANSGGIYFARGDSAVRAYADPEGSGKCAKPDLMICTKCAQKKPKNRGRKFASRGDAKKL